MVKDEYYLHHWNTRFTEVFQTYFLVLSRVWLAEDLWISSFWLGSFNFSNGLRGAWQSFLFWARYANDRKTGYGIFSWPDCRRSFCLTDPLDPLGSSRRRVQKPDTWSVGLPTHLLWCKFGND
jgi:hypothetical protein